MDRVIPFAGACLAFHVCSLARGAEPVIPEFEAEVIASGLEQPVAIVFAPDGRLFVAERLGAVKLIRDGIVTNPPVFQLDVHTFFESGLLGIALDPDFESNHYIYLFATVSDVEQQIMRITEVDGVGRDLVVIRSKIPTNGDNHHGGCIRFGPDCKLYFSVGDMGLPHLSQDMSTLAGKLCRINPDGTPPMDNPFRTPTGSPRSAYALGLRVPFRFAIAPDGRIFALDVGSVDPARQEEVNLIRAGDNCGWPHVEGFGGADTEGDFVDPILTYSGDKGAAPSGIVYYTGRAYPPEFSGNLFFADYISNRIYRLVLDGDQAAGDSTFVENMNGPVDLRQGPDGSLYACELFSGEIVKINYRGAVDSNEADNPPMSTYFSCAQRINTESESVVPSTVSGDEESATPPIPLPCGFEALGAFAMTVFLGAVRFKSRRRSRRRSAR